MVIVPEIKEKLKRYLPKEFASNGWRAKSTGIVFRNEMVRFTRAFRDNFFTLMISALGLLVALSWNEFWKVWVGTLTIEQTINAKFYIALGTTIFAVILTYFFSNLKSKQ